MTGSLSDGSIPLWTFLISVVAAGIGGAYLQSKLSGARSKANLSARNRKTENEKKAIAASDVVDGSNAIDEGDDEDGDNADDDDEDEEDNYSEGQIRNNYGITDAPFKMLLCVSKRE
jgi:hypothetical protein